MSNNKWTIKQGDVSGGAMGSKLNGCHIEENGTSTAYEFTHSNDVLSTYTASPLPTAFTFPTFTFSGPTWTIAVTSLDNNQVSGNWVAVINQTEETGEESGDFTAQAGTGEDEDEPETATSTTA